MHPYVSKLTRGDTILDLGGGADNTSYLSKTIESKVVSLDISPDMLKQNVNKLKVQADMEQFLPIQSGSINLVTSFFLMRYLNKEDHIRLLKEIWRVLVDGESFVLIDLPENEWSYQKSLFVPKDLVDVAKNIGFSEVLGKMENLSYYSGYNTGFGRIGSDIPFTLGFLKGEKYASDSVLYDSSIEQKYINTENVYATLFKKQPGF